MNSFPGSLCVEEYSPPQGQEGTRIHRAPHSLGPQRHRGLAASHMAGPEPQGTALGTGVIETYRRHILDTVWPHAIVLEASFSQGPRVSTGKLLYLNAFETKNLEGRFWTAANAGW
jgi:hypothetical protein